MEEDDDAPIRRRPGIVVAWPDAGGVLAEPRCFIRVISEPETLDAFGITSTGIAEVEGVKVWKGNLCFGVLSVGFNGENKPKANVFKYRLGTAGENMSSVDLEDAGIIEL